ncbi:MAG: TolC family protein [Balneolaceae bacterium]
MVFVTIALLPFIHTAVLAQVEKEEFFQNMELTLEEAIQVAVANSPQVKRALFSVEDADQLVKIAYSEVYPNISSSLNYTRNVQIPVSYLPAQIIDPTAEEGTLVAIPIGYDNTWQGGFTVNQNIFTGEVFVGLSTSTVFKTVQQENLRATTQQVITQTRLAYYNVLVAREQVRLQEAQINRLEQNLRENTARQRAGMIDEYDVLQLEVQLSNQRPQLIEARYAVNEAYRNLKIALGIPLSLNFEVRGNLNEFDIVDQDGGASEENEHIKRIDQMNPYTYQNVEAEEMNLTQSRGDLRVLGASLELKNKEIMAIKSRFLPTVSATYNLQWSAAEPGAPNFFQNPEPNTAPNRFQTLAVNVSLPIFEGFRRVADVQRAQIERKDLEEQKRLTTLTAENEIESAAEDLNKAFETAEARKQALSQAQQGYQRALRRLETGLGSQIEVTDAEVQVRESEINYALMVYEYLSAKAQYDLATGKVPFVDTEIE